MVLLSGSAPAMKQFQELNREFRSRTTRLSTQSKLPAVPQYRVGEPFLRGQREWPEGTQLTCGPSRCELTLFKREIRENTLADVRRGLAELALIVDLPVIVLAYRLGESDAWRDVPFSWHLQATGWRVIPSLDHSPEARVLLWISLVGAADGIIHAQRGMTMSPPFTFALHQAIRAQAMTPFDSKECAAAISRLYLNYSNIGERLSLATARTMGNE